MRPGRILLFVTDLEIGGTPTVVRELAFRLRGHASVTVGCLKPAGPVADELRGGGIPVFDLDARTPLALPAVVGRFAAKVKADRFDTVLSFLVHANAVAAAARGFCRGVTFIQSIQTTQPKPKWHWRVQSVAQRAADRVVVPSRSAGEVAGQWARVPREKIVVIPNAVDSSTIVSPPEGRSTGGSFRLGFVGRLDPVKRVPVLVGQVARLRSWGIAATLDIFGDGPERSAVEREIARQNLAGQVRLHGVIPRADAAWPQMDCLVLPSLAEGFGLVLIEAMAAGVPVVATDVPGIGDVVRHGYNGLLVELNALDGIALAVRRLVDEPQLRSELIANGQRHVREHFTWDVVLPQYLKLLNLI